MSLVKPSGQSPRLSSLCKKWTSCCLLALLLSTCIPVSGRDESIELTRAEKQQVLDVAWTSFHDLFYDTSFRGMNWDEVHQKYLSRIDKARTRQQLAALIREMIASLHNSHTGLLTGEEYKRTQNVLPFFFDSASGHIFVSYVFVPRQPGGRVPLQFGDEIINVDGRAATDLKLPSATWLDDVMSNPYYGPAKSTATVRIRRGNTSLSVAAPRVRRFADVMPLQVQKLDDEVVYLRFLKMDKEAIPAHELQVALSQTLPFMALIIDVRHCAGGDATIVDMVGGMLLGPGVELTTHVPRGASPTDQRSIVERTSDFGAHYRGKVVLLVDGNTESGPEMLAAALREYDRAVVVGDRTRGAFNGYTEGISLPFDVGILEVPINRSVSPQGKDYEGVGIPPDVASENSEMDFRTGRDVVIDAARHLLKPASAGHR
jgi:carboxyl-terminal processing protease